MWRWGASRYALGLAILPLLAAACTVEKTVLVVQPTATPAPIAASTIEPTGTPEITSTLPQAQVVRVIDGDTIEVLLDGQSYRVRYIGIDTPETVDLRLPVECFGREASERNRQLVEGKTVRLEKDVSETDAFARLLRYVWVDGQMINAALVEEGYATVATYPPDVKYVDQLLALQQQARQAGLGLWSACGLALPAATPGGQVCDYSATSEPVIKGNISVTSGEKIYHVPGGYYYDQTVIDESKGERWFCTEEEAVAAGWRKAKR